MKENEFFIAIDIFERIFFEMLELIKENSCLFEIIIYTIYIIVIKVNFLYNKGKNIYKFEINFLRFLSFSLKIQKEFIHLNNLLLKNK